MGTKVTSSSGSVLEEPEIQKLQMQAKNLRKRHRTKKCNLNQPLNFSTYRVELIKKLLALLHLLISFRTFKLEAHYRDMAKIQEDLNLEESRSASTAIGTVQTKDENECVWPKTKKGKKDELEYCEQINEQDSPVCKENASNVFRKEREQYHEIQDLKAQLQDKNIAISELKKLIENWQIGKSLW
ncbi:hypothetical protein Tco_1300431 [Tanacetum coccineum]